MASVTHVTSSAACLVMANVARFKGVAQSGAQPMSQQRSGFQATLDIEAQRSCEIVKPYSQACHRARLPTAKQREWCTSAHMSETVYKAASDA